VKKRRIELIKADKSHRTCYQDVLVSTDAYRIFTTETHYEILHMYVVIAAGITQGTLNRTEE